ncbi:MAG: hypothetical protein V4490_05275, partial [Pseudomonadota bacterium]
TSFIVVPRDVTRPIIAPSCVGMEIQAIGNEIAHQPGQWTQLKHVAPFPISSTTVREQLALNINVNALLETEVSHYIDTEGLYCSHKEFA